MEPEPGRRSGFSVKGSAGLIVAVAVVAVLLIMLPAYRWFFLISVLIGLVIAEKASPGLLSGVRYRAIVNCGSLRL